MFRIVVVFLLVLAAIGCGPDEGWTPNAADPQQDGGEDNMGTFHQTNLGNQIVMGGGLVGGQPPVDSVLLIETNLHDLSMAVESGQLKLPELSTSGSWVFVVDEIPTFPTIGGADVAINPLKLRFTMGSGGTHHVMEIDAIGGAVIQVPTAVCRVEVFWDRLPPLLNGAGALPWVIPTQVVVRGTFQRANAVPNARRSFYIGRDAALGPGQYFERGRIPQFAYDWMIYAPQVSSIYTGVTSNAQMQAGAGFGTVHEVTGGQLLAALITGARFPVPPGADQWEVNIDLPQGDIVQIDFGVGF